MASSKTKSLKIASNSNLPKDLFRDPETGRVQQKVDDDGIPNRRYLELKKKGLA